MTNGMPSIVFRRDDLNAALAVVGKVQPWKLNDKSPALIQIIVVRGEAAIVSTDLDAQIEVTCPCEGDDVCIVAPIALLAPFVAKAGAGSVALSRIDGGTVASAGRSRATMMGAFRQALPVRVPPRGVAATMPSQALRVGVASALPAAVEDMKRPYLGGVHVDAGGDGVAFIAQDGNRIHAIAQDGNRIHGPATIPRRAARLLAELLPDDGVASVLADERSIWVASGNLRISSQLINVPFPSVEQQLGVATDRELRCNAEQLLADLELVCAVAPQKDHDFRLDLGAACEASAFRTNGMSGVEAGVVALRATFAGAPLAIGFQLPLVRDALRLFGESDVIWRFGDAESPSLISSFDNPGVEAMVSPIRLIADHLRIAA